MDGTIDYLRRQRTLQEHHRLHEMMLPCRSWGATALLKEKQAKGWEGGQGEVEVDTMKDTKFVSIPLRSTRQREMQIGRSRDQTLTNGRLL